MPEIIRCPKCRQLYWPFDWRRDDLCPYCNPPSQDDLIDLGMERIKAAVDKVEKELKNG
jgi:uncharacterized protein with PIN domain